MKSREIDKCRIGYMRAAVTIISECEYKKPIFFFFLTSNRWTKITVIYKRIYRNISYMRVHSQRNSFLDYN